MIAAYLRVSTQEQDEKMQRDAVVKWADGRKLTWYTERISGTLATADRPELSRLLTDAKAHKFDRLVIWALDRLTRRGIADGLSILKALLGLGVTVESIQEPWVVATADVGMRDLLLAIAFWGAEQEQRRRKVNQAAGIAAVRRANGGICPWGGKRRGVRQLDPQKREAIESMLRGGSSWRAVGLALGVSPNTISRYVKEGLIESPQKISDIVVDRH